MKNQKIIIHPGYAKAASSLLQEQVFTEENNIITIRPIGPKYSNEYVDAAISAQKSKKTTIISSEFIGGGIESESFEFEIIKNIKKKITESKLLLIIREQANIIYASYEEITKAYNSRKMEEYVEAAIIGNYWDYDIVATWAFDIFGKENCLILPMEKIKMNKAQTAKNLSTFIGEQISVENLKKETNKQLHPWSLKIKRIFNIPFGNKQEGRKRLFLYSHLLNKIIYKIDERMPQKKRQEIREREREKVRQMVGDRYKKCNKRCEKILGIDLKKYDYPL